MPRLVEVPTALKPYVFHGLDVNAAPGSDEALGDCPWCGRESKFSVNVNSGTWRCLICGTGSERGGGNVQTFLRLLHKRAVEDTSDDDYEELAADRGISAETLRAWWVAKSPLTGEWLVPGYGPGGKLDQLYRYAKLRDRKALLATPGVNHGLFGVPLLMEARDRPDLYLCEGPWDAMALWEAMGSCRRQGGLLVETASMTASLLGEANVLGVPGAGTFAEQWCTLAAGKNVVLMYDNDYPKPHPTRDGELIDGGGLAGMKRTSLLLSRWQDPPATLRYLRWGDDPHNHNPDLADGADVRDVLNWEGYQDKAVALDDTLGRVVPIPDEWVPGRRPGDVASGKTDIECLPCDSWALLRSSWRKSGLMWIEGLDRGLAVMLAVAMSTRQLGDQLWVKVIGPASCGKSTLCEALSVNRRYVSAKSTIRGFHSGFKTDAAGREDNSLIAGLKDKTLITKDGDTLLQSPNLAQILSEARDIYDRTSRTHYRNRMGKDYVGVNMTWILCGTSSLRSLDSSELGERFLDCVIVEDIDDDLEDEVGWRVANRAERELGYEADGKPDTRDSPEMLLAKQLTGGYVNYLRENSTALLREVNMPATALRRCQALAKFVAYLRARPSGRQEEKAERELSYRLISQLVRLAKCLAAVFNLRSVDDKVMDVVRRTATDTARGKTLAIVRELRTWKLEGLESSMLSARLTEDEEKLRPLLGYLRKIGVVQAFRPEVGRRGDKIIHGHRRWRLTGRMSGLVDEVFSPYQKDPTE